MANKPLPPTKDGFRYFWGEDDSGMCKHYKNATNTNDAFKRLAFTKRKLMLPYVKLSENDRAPQLKLDGEFTVTGEKGYSMVRATHSANRGKFYYEVTIESMKHDPDVPPNQLCAARVGWGQKYANLQAPLGYDRYGYSYRSRFGTKFHEAMGKKFDTSGGYGEGDVIGCMIELPYGNDKNFTHCRHLPSSVKETCFVLKYNKKDNYEKPRILEETDVPPSDMKPLIGSKISFYKNGKLIDGGFADIYEGSYFPTISLYKNCRVKVNFGLTKFRYPPLELKDDDIKSNSRPPCLPVNYLAEQEMIDNLLSDILFVLGEEEDPSTAELKQLVELAAREREAEEREKAEKNKNAT